MNRLPESRSGSQLNRTALEQKGSNVWNLRWPRRHPLHDELV